MGGRTERDKKYANPRGLREPVFRRIYVQKKEDFYPAREELAKGMSPFGSPPEYEEILYDLVRSGDSYRAGREYREERLEPGKNYVRERFSLSKDAYVAFGAGGSDGLIRECFWIFEPAPTTSHIFILGPTFPDPVNFARLRNGRTTNTRIIKVETPLTYTLEEAIDAAIKRRGEEPENRRKTIMHYLCNPGTPKGDSVPLGVVREFVEFAASERDFVMVDEAFGDALADKQSAIPLTEEFPNLIVLRSLSKIIGLPGERIGYAVMSSDIGRVYESTRRVYEIPGHQQLIINRILKPEIINPHLANVRRKITEVKIEFVERLRTIGFRILPTDNRVPIFTVDGRYEDFYSNLKDRYGIDVVAGHDFFDTHSAMLGGRYIRVTIPDSIDKIASLVRDMEAARELFE